jgi:hypothetical protein
MKNQIVSCKSLTSFSHGLEYASQSLFTGEYLSADQSLFAGQALSADQSLFAGQYSKKINEIIKQGVHPFELSKVVRGEHLRQHEHSKTATLEERLYEARALCKIKTAEVAMYLTAEWRSRFFSQIDNLMDIENWEEDDIPITATSFTTLLRMLLLIWPVRRPGLGATSEGHIIATWTKDKDRLTIECLPADKVRWVLSRYFEGNRESGAGEVLLTRLPAVLAPYKPECWFADAT